MTLNDRAASTVMRTQALIETATNHKAAAVAASAVAIAGGGLAVEDATHVKRRTGRPRGAARAAAIDPSGAPAIVFSATTNSAACSTSSARHRTAARVPRRGRPKAKHQDGPRQAVERSHLVSPVEGAQRPKSVDSARAASSAKPECIAPATPSAARWPVNSASNNPRSIRTRSRIMRSTSSRFSHRRSGGRLRSCVVRRRQPTAAPAATTHSWLCSNPDTGNGCRRRATASCPPGFVGQHDQPVRSGPVRSLRSAVLARMAANRGTIVNVWVSILVEYAGRWRRRALVRSTQRDHAPAALRCIWAG